MGQQSALNSSGEPYKPAHENHPCTKWVQEGLLNPDYLYIKQYDHFLKNIRK